MSKATAALELTQIPRIMPQFGKSLRNIMRSRSEVFGEQGEEHCGCGQGVGKCACAGTWGSGANATVKTSSSRGATERRTA